MVPRIYKLVSREYLGTISISDDKVSHTHHRCIAQSPNTMDKEPHTLSAARLPTYISLYKHFHAHPELSNHELQTASTIQTHLLSLRSARHLRITRQIGGHGLVATCHNGPGPTILLRADMDALPIRESTGLAYASTTVVEHEGTAKPVMHACGHDMHVTCLLAAAEILTSPSCTGNWSGTLLLIFQPAEERGSGAAAMVADPHWAQIPRPDFLFGQHVVSSLPAGLVGLRQGTIMAGAESLRITLFGRGGHASQPHRAVDVSVLAANVVVRLQQIVSREIRPDDVAVLTAIPLSSGAAENILPDSLEVGVDIRFTSAETRVRLLEAVERVARAECMASNCPRDPEFRTSRQFPLTVNDPFLTKCLSECFALKFGDKGINTDIPVATIAEDFPNLAVTSDGQQLPYVFWLLGCGDEARYDLQGRMDAKLPPVPMNHSSGFAPVVEQTLKRGAESLVAAALCGFTAGVKGPSEVAGELGQQQGRGKMEAKL